MTKLEKLLNYLDIALYYLNLLFAKATSRRVATAF